MFIPISYTTRALVALCFSLIVFCGNAKDFIDGKPHKQHNHTINKIPFLKTTNTKNMFWGVNGEANPNGGGRYTYTADCWCYVGYWFIENGTNVSTTTSSVDVIWNSNNGSYGYVIALDEYWQYLGMIEVNIQPPQPLDFGYITSGNSSSCGVGYVSTLWTTAANNGSCNGSYYYQWESSTDNANWTAISGANSQHYAPGYVSLTTYYRRAVYCGSESGYTNTFVHTVEQVPPIPQIYASIYLLCDGGSSTLYSNQSSTRWYLNGSYIGDGASISVTSAGNYTARSFSSCEESELSEEITLSTSNTPAAPSISAGSTNLCNGASTTLYSSYHNTYWYLNGSFIGAGNTFSVSSAGTYTGRAVGTCGASNESNSIYIGTGSSPGAPSISAGSTALCNGGGTTLYSSDGSTYWYRDGSYIGSGSSISVATAGTYTALAYNSCGTSGWSNSIYISMSYSPGAPSISASSTLLCNGAGTTLYSSDGNTYWYRDGNYIGAGGSIYTTTAGTYAAIAYNSCGGSGWSNSIYIGTGSNPGAPSISAASTSFCNGSGTTLYSSNGNTYWYRDGNYIGAGGSIYITIAGNYYAIAYNSCGNSGNSNTIAISTTSTDPAPSISTATTNLCGGASTTLNSNMGNTYWYYNGSYIGAGWSITVSNAGNYTALSYNGCGNSGWSNTITLVTNPTPQPQINGNLSYACGYYTTLQAYNLSTGSNGGFDSYEWRNSSNMLVSSNQTANVNAGTYTLKVTKNGCEGFAVPQTVTVQGLGTPVIYVSSGNTTFCSGNGVTLTTTLPTYGSIQWRKDGIDISGATSENYYATDQGAYTVRVANQYGCWSAPSAAVNTTVLSYPNPGTIAGANAICKDATTTFTSNGQSGGTWYSDNTSIATVNSSGVVTGIAPGTVNINYTVSNGYCNSSNYKTITINALPTATISGSGGYCASGTTTLTANSANGYEWRFGGTTVGTAQTYTTGTAGNYSLFITDANGCRSLESAAINVYQKPTPQPQINGSSVVPCGQTIRLDAFNLATNSYGGFDYYTWRDGNNNIIANSSVADYVTIGVGTYKLSVIKDGCTGIAADKVVTAAGLSTPTISIQSGSTTFCTGATVQLQASTSGNAAETFQWYRNGSVMPGQTNRSLTTGSDGYYQVIITLYNCVSPISGATTVTVLSYPNAGTITGANAICRNTTTTFTSNGQSGGTWTSDNTSIATVNSSGVVTAIAPGTVNINYTVSNGYCNASNYKTITINALPTATISGTNNFCAGGTTTLTANSANSYEWKFAGATVGTAQTYAAGTEGNYSLFITDANGCRSLESAPINVYQNIISTPTIGYSGQTTFCDGNSITLTSSSAPSGGSYIWYKDGIEQTTFTAQNFIASETGIYTVQTKHANGCVSTISTGVSVSKLSIPAAGTISGTSSICIGSSTTLSISGASGGTGTWSSLSPSVATVSNGVVSSQGVGTATIRYTVDNGYCSRYTDFTVTVNALPTPIISPQSATAFCAGGSVVLGTGVYSNYQWLNAQGNNISGATGATYTATTGDNYSVRVTNANGCIGTSSSATTVTVYALPATPTITPLTATSRCVGETVSVQASSALQYQWRKNGTDIVGETNQQLNTTTSGSYQVVVFNANGCATVSSAINIAINDNPVVPAITGADALYINTATNFTNSSSGGNWYSSNTNIATAGLTTGVISGIAQGSAIIEYKLINASNCSTSVYKSIQVYDQLIAGTVSPAYTIITTNSIMPTLQAGAASGGNGQYNYNWQLSTDGSSWQNISGANNLSYQPASITTATYYRLGVTSAGVTVYSNTATIGMALQATTIGANPQLVTNGTTTLQQLTAPSNGTCGGNYSIQWQKSYDKIEWLAMGSPNVSGINTTMYFRQQVTCGNQVVVSNIVQVKPARNAVQITPDGSTTTATQPVKTIPTPTISDANNLNYIRVREFTKAGITDIATANATNGVFDVKESTTYFDGLGRPIQSVAKQVSPNQADLVTVNVYDALGREAEKYLPYADGVGTGSFRLNAASMQPAFYNNRFGNTESHYYSSTQFEASPLNRALRNTAPGKSFTGNNIGVSQFERTNVSTDSVWMMRITNEDPTTLPQILGYYPAGKLWVSENTDEHDNMVITYKDMEGQVVFKKVQVSDVALSTGFTGWLCTYYVHDDFNQLRFVLQPKAVNLVKAGNTIASVADELCFRYGYDERNRMVAKKVPGAAWVYMVYDKRDRLLYTQDGNMRNTNKWMLSLYDAQNRPVSTGMITYVGTRESLQASTNTNFDAAITTEVKSNIVAPPTNYITVRSAGTNVYMAEQTIHFTTGFTTEPTASFTTQLGPAITDSVRVIQNFNPLPTGAVYTALTLSYYDNYAATTKQYNTTDNNKLDAGTNSNALNIPTTASTLVRGVPTVSRIRVVEDPMNLESGTWLETVSYYDDKGRVVQTQSDNYKGGIDRNTLRYDFSGKVLSSYQLHNNASAAQTVRAKTNMQYDHAGRLLELKKTLNDDAATTRLLARNEYDELGMLKRKKLGQKTAIDATELELQDYAYSIRGWLKGINNDYATGGNTRWFGMDIGYDQGYTINQYNGNISGMKWRSRGDGEQRAYGFAYDPLNRLLKGDFNQFTGGAWNKNAGIDFSMKMGDGQNTTTAYDENGNILSMSQWGAKLINSVQIDQLSYTYNNNSNKLLNVIDGVNDTATVLGDFRSSKLYMTSLNNNKTAAVQDYNYDINGNLTEDKNKDITNINYNHLNLPYTVTVTGKGTIKYIYDATGNKLEKRTQETSPQVKTTTTSYIGSYVYQNDSLQFMGHEEGRVRVVRESGSPTYSYDYFVKDHLGNTRVVLTDEQKTDAYPVASLEDSTLNTEKIYYNIPNGGRILKNTVAAYPTNENYTNPNDYIQKLNGNNQKVGTSIVLKVMAGDKVNIRANSWYKQNGVVPGNAINPINDIIASLMGGLSSNSTKSWLLSSIPNGWIPPGMSGFISGQNNADGTNGKPKAYLNWVLFDEQFKPVIDTVNFSASQTSGFEQVGASEEFKTHLITDKEVTRNGYLYIYVSNATPNIDVFFDNLQVTHTRGPLTEETHYYPFGLTMKGISSKAANSLENRYRYNDASEENNDLGLDWYETEYRSYDAQLGRFHQMDPLADYFEDQSTYNFADNNPVNFNDPLGLSKETPKTNLPEVVVVGIRHKKQSLVNSPPTNLPNLKPMAINPKTGSTVAKVENSPTPKTQVDIPQNIKLSPGVDKNSITQYTIDVLEDILKSSENPSLKITSTQRSPEAQANAMYDNIESRGVKYNLDLYGSAGDQVVNVAQDGINKGLNRQQIISNMSATIRRIGPRKVSRHASDPRVLNVIDISPASIQNRKRFVEQIRARGIFLLQPPADPAYHLEIKQK